MLVKEPSLWHVSLGFLIKLASRVACRYWDGKQNALEQYSLHRGGDQNLLDRGALGKAVDGGEILIIIK